MLKAVQAGLIGRIIVDRQDRFGVADAYQWGKFISLLRDHGTTLEDADGKVLSADDDVSILTGTLGAITSTREQKEKAHRNITGKVGKAKEGEYQGGYPPYGCDVVCFGADGKEKWRTVYVGQYKRWRVWPNGRREQFDGKDNSPRKDPTDKLFIRPSIEKDRTSVAGQIFGWYAEEDISPRQIATRLTDMGVDAIYGNGWDKVRIRGMLGNPAYIGFPTWNKQGSSRFVEYVDGNYQEVQDKITGRKRTKADYVQPARPLYKPLVPQKTWDKVQVKLQSASEECRKIPRRPVDTAELYLRPFMVCAHCGKFMHATMARGTPYLQASYFCASYSRHGAKNPTGCHCHRVYHTVIEKIVKAYLAETAPKIAQLLEATDTGDLTAAQPLLNALTDSTDAFRETACNIEAFIASNEDEEVERLRGERKGLDEIYGVLYERFRPEMEAAIAEKDAALEKLLDEYVGLPANVKERMNKRIEALQNEINALKERLIDLREPWGNLQGQLVDRRKAVDNAVKVLGKTKNGRQKTEALKSVIKEIRCTFRHAVRKDTTISGKRNNGKSFLETVEIVPIAGETRVFSSFNDGSMPGPD
jgi:site-specific DNA recombinase